MDAGEPHGPRADRRRHGDRSPRAESQGHSGPGTNGLDDGFARQHKATPAAEGCARTWGRGRSRATPPPPMRRDRLLQEQHVGVGLVAQPGPRPLGRAPALGRSDTQVPADDAHDSRSRSDPTVEPGSDDAVRRRPACVRGSRYRDRHGGSSDDRRRGQRSAPSAPFAMPSRAAQATDPLAPVTLIVDSAAQAWALRRQVAETAHAGTRSCQRPGHDMIELLSGLARRIGSRPRRPPIHCSRPRSSRRSCARSRGRWPRRPITPIQRCGWRPWRDELAWCRLGDRRRLPSRQAASRSPPVLPSDSSRMRDPRSRLHSGRPRGPTPRRPSTAALTAGIAALPRTSAHSSSPAHGYRRPSAMSSSALAEHAAVTRRRRLTPDPVPHPGPGPGLPGSRHRDRVRGAPGGGCHRGGSEPGPRRHPLLGGHVPTPACSSGHSTMPASPGTDQPARPCSRPRWPAACSPSPTLAAARADGCSGMTRPLLMRLLALGHLGRRSSVPLPPVPAAP